MRGFASIKSFGLLTSLLLIAQCAIPIPIRAADCALDKCIYLPSVVRPPYLIVWYDPPIIVNSTLLYFTYIQNTSPVALKDIILKMERYDDTQNPFSETYTRTLFASSGVSVLPPGEYVPFYLITTQVNFQTPVLSLSAPTWTVASATENLPVSVTNVFTAAVLASLTSVTITIRNPYSQTLRNTEVSGWFIDQSGQSSCNVRQCYGRGTVPFLYPGELYTFTTSWSGTGYIPREVIQVSAHGVISP